MKTGALIVLTVVVAFGLIMSQAGAKRDDLYEEYETLTTIVDKILSNYVTEVDKEQLFYGAFDGMLQSLDPYSQFLPPPKKEDLDIDTTGEFGGIGIEITLDEHRILTVITPLEGTPAFRAGVRAGDKIWKINGKSSEGMSLFDAVKVLRGKKGDPVTITVTHETDPAEPVDITIVREKTPQDLDAAITELLQQGMQALILDLRFNPGGLLTSAVKVCDRFIDEGVIVSTKGRNNVTKEVFRAHTAATYRFPMAVLVSGQSASASEIVAGAVQDHKRAVVIGARTYGKGSVQSVISLDKGKCAMRLTTAYYYTPSGRLIHRKPDAAEDDDWGIYPDIEVQMTPEEYVRLWKQWRRRHIEQNRAPQHGEPTETQAIDATGEQDVKTAADDEDTATEPAGETDVIAPTQTQEEPIVVDKQLEAAKLFLSGQLFRERAAAAK